jgi:Ca2+-binding EF-hand superfamily protein
MLTNKAFLWSQCLVMLSVAFVFPSYAATMASLESSDSSESSSVTDELEDINYGLKKTLEHNFSPVDRALLRKALTDYARNNDPEHIKIKRQRQLMRDSLKERFAQCNKDLDDSLDRQEVTECMPQIARHFNAVDIDENNVITFEELELAQAKWRERHRAAEAKLELQRIKEAEAEIKNKAAQPKESKQAATSGQHPS